MMDHPRDEHLDDEGWQRMCQWETMRHRGSLSNPLNSMNLSTKMWSEVHLQVCAQVHIARAFHANLSELRRRGR